MYALCYNLRLQPTVKTCALDRYSGHTSPFDQSVHPKFPVNAIKPCTGAMEFELFVLHISVRHLYIRPRLPFGMIALCVQEQLNVRETVVFGAYGSAVSHVGHFWYRYLHVITKRTLRLRTYPMIGAKLFADLFIFNTVHVAALISWTHLAMLRPVKVRTPQPVNEISLPSVQCTWIPLCGVSRAQ
jgi:hypothetical protein